MQNKKYFFVACAVNQIQLKKQTNMYLHLIFLYRLHNFLRNDIQICYRVHLNKKVCRIRQPAQNLCLQPCRRHLSCHNTRDCQSLLVCSFEAVLLLHEMLVILTLPALYQSCQVVRVNLLCQMIQIQLNTSYISFDMWGCLCECFHS